MKDKSHWFHDKFILPLLIAGLVGQPLKRGLVSAQTYCEDKPKILFYRKGQAALVSGGSDEVNNHVVVSNVNKEFLACVSSRNVEWAYDGEGEPSKFQESSTVDIQKYDDASISYCLTSQITFYNKQSDSELSRHTGRYSCREIGNITNAASVYVFASRRNSPTFLHSRKTVTLPLSQANISSSFSSNPSSSSGPTNDDVDATKSFTIPCVTTRPNVAVSLLKKEKNNDFRAYIGASYEFDPKYGIRIKVPRENTDDLSRFYGEYKCVSKAIAGRSAGSSSSTTNDAEDSESGQAEDFVLLTIIKAKSFHVFPAANEVYTSGLLNFTCESEEPVIMKEVLPPAAQDVYSYLDEDDYTRDRSEDIVETTERTDQKTHIANYMELSPASGRTGEIQCITEKDAKVLHTWKYKVIRRRADKLSGIKFNKRENSFTCKSKLGAPGKLSFVSCRTPSECRVNRICLAKSENCRGYSNSTRAFCERKSHFCGKIFYKGGSGLIRCIGEGIDEIRGFTDEAADQTMHMGFSKLKASETALLELAAIEKKSYEQNDPQHQNNSEHMMNEIIEGDQVNLTLRLGYYYFLYPVQWAVKFQNGSTMQINPESQSVEMEKLTRNVHASITIPFTSATVLKIQETDPSRNESKLQQQQPKVSEIVAVHALIPLRSSVDPSWKTISLPLTVFGRLGLKQLPSDVDSEEVELPQQQSVINDKNMAAATDIDSTATEQADVEADDDEEEDEEDDTQPESSSATTQPEISSPVKVLEKATGDMLKGTKDEVAESDMTSQVSTSTISGAVEQKEDQVVMNSPTASTGNFSEDGISIASGGGNTGVLIQDPLARSGLINDELAGDEGKTDSPSIHLENSSDNDFDASNSTQLENEATTLPGMIENKIKHNVMFV